MVDPKCLIYLEHTEYWKSFSRQLQSCATTARVASPDGNTDYSQILFRDLLEDTLLHSRFIITIDFALRKVKEDHEHLGFTLVERRSRRYPPQRIMHTNFSDDIATFSDTIQNAALLLHNTEIAAKEADLLINKSKTEFMSFNWNGTIQSLNRISLNVVADYKCLRKVLLQKVR